MKSIAEGSVKEIKLENDFYLLRIQNDSTELFAFERFLDKTVIQMHFSLKGEAVFNFNNVSYQLQLT